MPFLTPEKNFESLKTSSRLPKHIPFKNTAFKQFFAPSTFDQDYFNNTEDELGTIGEILEQAFCWKSQTTGDATLPIQERGPGLLVVHVN